MQPFEQLTMQPSDWPTTQPLDNHFEFIFITSLSVDLGDKNYLLENDALKFALESIVKIG